MSFFRLRHPTGAGGVWEGGDGARSWCRSPWRFPSQKYAGGDATGVSGFDDIDGIIYNTTVKPIQTVLDTNVLVSALKSNRGASHKLLGLVGKSPEFEINLSVPLVLEYEHALKNHSRSFGLSNGDIDDVLDYLCSVANKREIFFLWRPHLPDPNDDLVLELAVESSSQYIVTFNKRHFVGSEDFGVKIIRPRDFLKILKQLT